MNDRKIPIDLECGLNIYALAAGGKWKACILNHIDNGTKRPSEIHKAMDYATPRVLNMQIRELHDHNIIAKTVYHTLPLKVEYDLTELGRSLLPILHAMESWGVIHRETIVEKRLETK